MTSPAFEAFLARLYVDDDLRSRFMSDARATAESAGLSAPEIEALTRIDQTGLELASRSFEAKRKSVRPRAVTPREKLLRTLRRFRLVR